MVGVRFRPQGKDPVTGLDCVGLVWAAYAAAGRRLVRPANYPLRGWGLERIEGALAVADFVRADDAMRVGDVALIGHPAGQYHLGMIGHATFIHAHPGRPPVVAPHLDTPVSAAARWRVAAAT